MHFRKVNDRRDKTFCVFYAKLTQQVSFQKSYFGHIDLFHILRKEQEHNKSTRIKFNHVINAYGSNR